MSVPDIPWPGRRRLNHPKQLQTNSRWESSDCGLCAMLCAIQDSSGSGLIRIPREDMAEWITALRSRMPHGPTWPATRPSDWQRAMSSELVRGMFFGAGRKAPSTPTGVVSHDFIVTQLAKGRSFVVAINYGTVNDRTPELSGAPSFRGGHAIYLGGLVRKNGIAYSRLGDSLHDGRVSSGKRVPRGFQTVRVRRYLRAAETWGTGGGVGKGRAMVMVVPDAGGL